MCKSQFDIQIQKTGFKSQTNHLWKLNQMEANNHTKCQYWQAKENLNCGLCHFFLLTCMPFLLTSLPFFQSQASWQTFFSIAKVYLTKSLLAINQILHSYEDQIFPFWLKMYLLPSKKMGKIFHWDFKEQEKLWLENLPIQECCWKVSRRIQNMEKRSWKKPEPSSKCWFHFILLYLRHIDLE